MSKRRYLIDENITPALANQLRRYQPDLKVATIGDGLAPPKGTLDPDVLLWLEQYDYSLVTRNRKSMPKHLQDHLASGHHILGIFTLRPKARLSEILEDLLLIWELTAIDEYQDQIVHIPL
ncbi:DUF5615 domain-containing protein [Candidatus Magnetomoraceae bacterium gMMP-1]